MDLGEEETRSIRQLNDSLRCHGIGGRVVVTAGIAALGEEKVRKLISEVAAFTAFTEDNDPHGEHDCAAIDVSDLHIIWKIDYFDNELHAHSPDPADAVATARVMTIMLAEEY